ncbi:MAG: VOC family protein [Planctomycetes bacterium]|nr:VOC family protein [Planctomycetota bacterium]
MAAKKQKAHPNAIHLTVANVPRSSRWYAEKLGFELTEAYPDAERPVWANLVLNGQTVMLGELPTLQEARGLGMDPAEIEVLKQDARQFARGTPGVGVTYYVAVRNVDAFARRLKKQRLKPLLPPKTQFYGLRDCHVVDPDGYRLVFYTRVPAPAGAPAAG